MVEEKEILLNIYSKKFGKNFISYKVQNVKTHTVLDEGKCKDMIAARNIYVNLMNTYGEENVLLLQN